VIKQIYGLAANSKSLSDVLARMDEIANQINLLTLSTVMEISRKDSESNTFNILADELRKLSKQTKDDNLQSRKIISDIQSQSKHMEVLEEELSGITNDALKLLALSTERSLEISNQMQFLKDSSEVLQEEYEIDGKEFTEIRHSIDKLRLSMGRHSYLAKQVSQETAELTHLRNRLKESVNYFHSNGNGHVEEESTQSKVETTISQEKESI
jgi:methyl-accepting chemotaxis protein